jgi:hypothetical protein
MLSIRSMHTLVQSFDEGVQYAGTSPVGSRPPSPIEMVDNDGYIPELRDLIKLLESTQNSNMGLRLFKQAYIQNMKYKVARYRELTEHAEQNVQKQREILNLKIPELRKAAGVKDDADNWQIFQSVSDQYLAAKDQAAAFEAIRMRAEQCLEGTMHTESLLTKDDIRGLRDELVTSLHRLSNFSTQAHVISKAVDIVGSFIKDPKLFRTKLMNIMLLGGAGTGKTTLAAAIGDVFARAGIFVGNRLIEAGRAELVGQYEGQTVTKTRNFLTSHLDDGVIFIDEAYAITPWQNGKPEGYGSEAMTAMVEFMTRYPGLYCIIVAGYEKDMRRYFLPCNEGLSRRFPNKYVLYNMDAGELVRVFKRALLVAQGQKVPYGNRVELESTDYFDDAAWSYLEAIVEESLSGTDIYVDEEDASTKKMHENVRVFDPKWTYMYTIFQNQAGSMTNLADEAITVLMRTLSFQSIFNTKQKNKGVDVRPHISQHGVAVMRDVLLQTILKSSFSNYEQFVAEFVRIEDIIRP